MKYFIYGYRNWYSELYNDEGTYYLFEKLDDETQAKNRVEELEKFGWHVTVIKGDEISFKASKEK
jgi:hypothetical protein